MRLPEDAIERLLDAWPVGRLATLDAEGRAHQVPIVFARCGGRLWSAVDGKPKQGRELSRVRNVLRDGRVGLLLDHYDADWSALWWIRVDARAELVRPADPERDPRVASAVAALQLKYPQYAEVPILGTPPTMLALRPTAIHSWCWGPEAVPN